jgi:hypothetical protein
MTDPTVEGPHLRWNWFFMGLDAALYMYGLIFGVAAFSLPAVCALYDSAVHDPRSAAPERM